MKRIPTARATARVPPTVVAADRALRHRRAEIARACLPRGDVEASELLLGEPDANLAVEHPDRRRNSAGRPHRRLRLEPDHDALARREAVRDEGRLERHDCAASRERVAHLGAHADHAARSISTKRLSSADGTSRKPARRYARRARSFHCATQSRNIRGRHSRRA